MPTDSAVSEPPRVLVVEDDLELGRTIEELLDREGYRVARASTVPEAQAAITSFRPDLALLDVALPEGGNGFDLAAELRATTTTPFVFLTAADALSDRLRGFSLGADDYLVKPFALAELLARLRAILRRAGRLQSATIEVRDLLIDEQHRTVRRGDATVPLTPLEFDLLVVLARSPGQTFSKQQLLALVWSFGELNPNVVEVHISALRRKLEAHGPRLVETVRNGGYQLRA